MGKETEIAWTDHTFNAWIGCDKVSPGCKNCYAEVDTPTRVHRAKGLELWGTNASRHRTSDDYWKQPWRWNKAAMAAGVRRRVFAQSLSDTFEDRRDLDSWRTDLFALISETPALDWLLLTKRPENMARLAPASWAQAWPRNVWAGCTVENQEAADRRVPELLRVPAAVRFLSVEPMLGAVDLSPWLNKAFPSDYRKIDWIIVGGESGPGARPFDLRWARSIADQCKAAGIPFFFKQTGAVPLLSLDAGQGRSHDPEHAPRLRQWTSGLASRLYYGLNDKKGGDVTEISRVYPDFAAAGVFRREWPEVPRAS